MKKAKANLLLVEDDDNLGFILKDYLEMIGYKVDLQKDGVAGMESFNANREKFDLCILDIMLPKKDGFTVAQEIRLKSKSTPIIFLTAKSMKEDRIKGLKVGADDYITKPFSTEELTLRIEAILRRYQTTNKNPEVNDSYQIGAYTFDYNNQLLVIEDQEMHLTKKEAEVLHLLCLHRDKLLRREVVLKNVWGENDYFMGRSMDVYITKLRKYLKADERISILNIHGTGFRLEVNEDNGTN